ncbi:MAG: Ger(x)C family spore germination protein [Ruminiclostridium sp.]|nr:Ger(x)C family spore germination protein [Ruminiclostridium sp.]
MNRIILPVMIFIILITSLTGCFDATEVDDIALVLSIGVDRGVSDKWRLTVQYPTMKGKASGTAGGGAESSQESDYATETVDAPSFFTGLNMINTNLPRKLNLMHTKFLVFSEDLAMSGDIGEFLAPIVRFREVRRSIHVIVSRGPAMDFVKNNEPVIGITLSKSNENTILNGYLTTGFLPHSTISTVYNRIKSPYRQAFAILGAVNNQENFIKSGPIWGTEYKSGGEYKAGEIPREKGNKLELFGSAVFDGDKMVGELNGDETRYLLILLDEFKRGYFTIKDPKKPDLIIPLDVRQKVKPAVKVRFEGDKVFIHVVLKLEGELLAVQSRIFYESRELKPVLEEAFEQQLKTGLEEVIRKCQGLNSDVFNFGGTVVRHFGTIQQWEDYNWLKRFKDAQITTEVEFIVKRTGTFIKSSPILSVEGKD